MTLAAIMVTVDFDPASKARISLAADLARRFGSLLIGVAGWPLIKRPVETLSDVLENALTGEGKEELLRKLKTMRPPKIVGKAELEFEKKATSHLKSEGSKQEKHIFYSERKEK